MVLRTDMNIIANNIANMNTPGYRAQNTLFNEYISDPRGADDPLSFVFDRGQYQVSESGPVRETGNPLDVALVGPGFIGIQGADGETYFSRAGEFLIGPNGALTTPRGQLVQNAGGGQITIPADSTEIEIDDKGVISNQNGPLGQIMVVEFANIQELEARGDNLYATEAEQLPPDNTRVIQGAIEGSNVKAVLEMTRMIDTSRTFQSVQSMMQGENERLRNAIRKLLGTN